MLPLLCLLDTPITVTDTLVCPLRVVACLSLTCRSTSLSDSRYYAAIATTSSCDATVFPPISSLGHSLASCVQLCEQAQSCRAGGVPVRLHLAAGTWHNGSRVRHVAKRPLAYAR